MTERRNAVSTNRVTESVDEYCMRLGRALHKLPTPEKDDFIREVIFQQAWTLSLSLPCRFPPLRVVYLPASGLGRFRPCHRASPARRSAFPLLSQDRTSRLRMGAETQSHN